MRCVETCAAEINRSEMLVTEFDWAESFFRPKTCLKYAATTDLSTWAFVNC